MTTWTVERAIMAGATARGDWDTADEARRNMVALRLEEVITKMLATTHLPLTSEQRARLAALFCD